MKKLILFAIIAFVIAVAYISYSFGTGYVLLSFAEISIEMSLFFALGVLTISYILINYTLRILHFIVGLPLYLRMRKKQHRAEHARQSLIK